MLYDPKWEVKTTERDRLIAWLEQQPPGKTYKYTSCRSCMLAQFYGTAVNNWGVFDGAWKELPAGFNEIAITEPWTMGAALERARR